MTCTHSLADREVACADGMCPFCLAVERDEAVRLLKRARWFVKQENDACIVACAENPDYCCADTLTAIDDYLAKVGK